MPPLLHLLHLSLRWLLLGAACCVVSAQAQTGELRFNRALSVAAGGESFPASPSPGVVDLPDDWSRSRGVIASGPVWYRVSFDAMPRPDDDLRALWIRRACTSLQVQLNGVQLHTPGRMHEPMTYLCQQPQLVPLPAALLRPGTNVIDIQVAGHALAQVASRHRAGGLSALEIDWHDDLLGRHLRAQAISLALPQALSATLLLLGGFMFVLGFVRRQDSHLAYFGALCFGWALGDARLWLRELPIPNAGAEFLVASLLPFMTLAGVQFMLRHVRRRVRLLDVVLPLQCAVMPLSLVLAGPQRLYPMVMAWELLLMLQVAAASLTFVHTLRRQGRALLLPAATLVALAVAGAVEFATQVTGAREAWGQAAMLLPPLLFAGMGLHLVHEHGRAFNEVEALKAQLEQRVREATAEVERNYTQMAELRVEQVTQQERKRIAADLHDDLGAKLLTIVHTSESERISTLAREALEEMRLSVRGLTGRAVLLADAIGDWRAEIVSRLGQAGIEAQWTAPEDNELLQRLSARAYVQTTRILREATSNIIKHSGATRCMIECAVAEGDFVLVIRDNGAGISPDVEMRIDRGHGLASMKQRAKQLQGQCLVESGPGYGTVIRLTLPMDRATVPA